MLIPTHGLLSAEIARRLESEDVLMTVIGGLLPDMPYAAKALALLTRGELTAEGLDYGQETSWPLDLWLHSVIPPAILLALTGKNPGLRALAAGWIWHNLIDFWWHHTDARPLGYPVIRKRFHSPLSNSEGRFKGAALLLEAAICAWALRSMKQRREYS